MLRNRETKVILSTLLKIKVRAGALQFAILVSVIIALLISSFILLTYTQLQFSKRISLSSEVIRYCHMGMEYAKQSPLDYGIPISPSILDSEHQLELVKTHWGMFDKVMVNAQIKTIRHQKIGLLGGRLPKENRLALYLEDTNSPLVVVGKTNIYGNVKLPKRGVKAGYIGGKSYYGTSLVHGNTGISTSNLPAIDPQKRTYISKLLFDPVFIEDSLFITTQRNEPLKNTFASAPKWMYRKGIIHLNAQEIQNNIIVKSDTLIRVSALVNVKNIILIAPHIIIEEGVKGSFQAFASRHIEVDQGSVLSYPTVLCVIEREETGDNIKGIHVEKGAMIAGSLMYLNSAKRRFLQPAITIGDNAVVTGEVYCERSVQVNGSIYGSVYTHKFATGTRGSIYQNHIYNGTLDVRPLPESFSGMVRSDTYNDLVQWMH